MTRWRLSTNLLGVLVLMLSVLGIAAADVAATPAAAPCENGAADENNPNCEDGDFDPPCDEEEEKSEPECQDDEGTDPGTDPGDEGCTDEDTDGLEGNEVASGVIDQITDEAAANGAPPELTDGIDTVNCEVVVTIEQAIEGGGGDLPAPPDELPAPPGDGDDGDDGDGGDGSPAPPALPDAPDELPELPAPGGEEPPVSCDDLAGGLDTIGAPAELADPINEGCTTLEDSIPAP